jgi:hypothetical protein
VDDEFSDHCRPIVTRYATTNDILPRRPLGVFIEIMIARSFHSSFRNDAGILGFNLSSEPGLVVSYWCWFKPNNTLWEIWQFYIPLYVSAAIALFTFVFLICKIRAMDEMRGSTAASAASSDRQEEQVAVFRRLALQLFTMNVIFLPDRYGLAAGSSLFFFFGGHEMVIAGFIRYFSGSAKPRFHFVRFGILRRHFFRQALTLNFHALKCACACL